MVLKSGLFGCRPVVLQNQKTSSIALDCNLKQSGPPIHIDTYFFLRNKVGDFLYMDVQDYTTMSFWGFQVTFLKLISNEKLSVDLHDFRSIGSAFSARFQHI